MLEQKFVGRPVVGLTLRRDVPLGLALAVFPTMWTVATVAW